MNNNRNYQFYYYQIYGLTLRTNQPLAVVASLNEATDVYDVSIHLARTWEESPMPLPPSAWQPSPKHPLLKTATLDEGTYLLLSFIGDEQAYAEFVINPSGEQVWMAVGEGANQRFVDSLLLGIVLGCILRIRGVTCLHGNVVIVENQGIAILGAKGAGKSTTTAALLQHGMRLLADDVATLSEQKNTFLVQPGYPGLRLHEDVATQLYGSYKHLEVLTPKPEIWPAKRNLYLSNAQELFLKIPVYLAAIYILEKRNPNLQSVSIEPVSLTTGLFYLMQNTYVDWMLNQTEQKNELQLLSRLVSKVPVRRVYRPDNLAMLPQLCEAIINDAHTTPLSYSKS
ncbi:hypothetical protein [Nostoc sp.]|uniref:hypothetical protein n=1 Tax=Nostoc sp. TaxID=1180 RepID=UPI002FFBC3E7